MLLALAGCSSGANMDSADVLNAEEAKNAASEASAAVDPAGDRQLMDFMKSNMEVSRADRLQEASTHCQQVYFSLVGLLIVQGAQSGLPDALPEEEMLAYVSAKLPHLPSPATDMLSLAAAELAKPSPDLGKVADDVEPLEGWLNVNCSELDGLLNE